MSEILSTQPGNHNQMMDQTVLHRQGGAELEAQTNRHVEEYQEQLGTGGHMSVAGGHMPVAGGHMPVAGKDLSAVEKGLLATGGHMPVAGMDLSSAEKTLQVAGKDLSSAEKTLQVEDKNLSSAEKTLQATGGDMSVTGANHQQMAEKAPKQVSITHYLVVTSSVENFTVFANYMTQCHIAEPFFITITHCSPKASVPVLTSVEFDDVTQITNMDPKYVPKVVEAIKNLDLAPEETYITVVLSDVKPYNLLLSLQRCPSDKGPLNLFDKPYFCDMRQINTSEPVFNFFVPLFSVETTEDNQLRCAPFQKFQDLPALCQEEWRRKYVNLFSPFDFRIDGFPLIISVVLNYLKIHKPRYVSQHSLKKALEDEDIVLDLSKSVAYLSSPNNPDLYILRHQVKNTMLMTPFTELKVDYDVLDALINYTPVYLSDLLRTEFPIHGYLKELTFNRKLYTETQGEISKERFAQMVKLPTLDPIVQPSETKCGQWACNPDLGLCGFTYKEDAMNLKLDNNNYLAMKTRSVQNHFDFCSEKVSFIGEKTKISQEVLLTKTRAYHASLSANKN